MTKTNKESNKKVKLTPNQQFTKAMRIMENATTSRRLALERLLNPDRDINYECGYPDTIDIKDYKAMYDREGVGTRVVKLLPEESWALLPKVNENTDSTETSFEKEWKDLDRTLHLWHYLQRVDILSGIGEYGILLLGIDDGQELKMPIAGVDKKDKRTPLERNENGDIMPARQYNLMYLKVFDESVVKIVTTENDVKSSRFGLPTMYSVEFETQVLETSAKQVRQIHWTRVLHISDNKEVSEVLGIPRMQTVYNRLLDLRKIVAGSGEMFWRGAYPGFVAKLDEGVTLTDTEKTTLREELKDYADGLQRWMSLGGVSIEELKPQLCGPKEHIEGILHYIAITLGIPFRILLGSEAAHLASDQDMKTWNKRLSKRQKYYLTPFIIRPLIDRLMELGVMSAVEEYEIEWPDLNAPSESEIAEIAAKRTDAYAKYVAGSVDQLIPPKEFLMMIMEMSEEDAETIIKAAMAYGEDLTEKDEEERDDEAMREAVAADEATARQIEVEKVKAAAKASGAPVKK